MKYDAVSWVVLGAAAFSASATFGDDKAGTPRRIDKEVVVQATVADVWTCWTTSDGAAKFGPEKAHVELKLDGAFEWYFNADAPPGQRGSEGCRVLSYIPMEMLAFSWNAPPSIPEIRDSGEKTQVVLRFSAVDAGRTRVHLTQHGFGEGEPWERYYQYFDRAWGSVLKSLEEHFAKNPSTGKQLDDVTPPKYRNWEDGPVTVRATYAPFMRQEFIVSVPAPAERVWAALATTEGFRRHFAPNAEIELKPGGAYRIWPEATNKVLAFVPGEMLSTSGSAPPEFPNVRKGGTWSAYFLEPIGPKETRVRLVVEGWKSNDAEHKAAFEYFNRNNPVFLRSLREKLARESGAALLDPLRHEVIVDAPPSEVWKAFTTAEGLKSWMVPLAEIDLRVGGVMRTNYNKDGTLGDGGTIENTILSFHPGRMLSIKATKAPEKFPFKAQIENMWSVLYFEPTEDGRTRVSCYGFGWDESAMSQSMRTHFDTGNQWTLNKLREHFANSKAASEASAAR